MNLLPLLLALSPVAAPAPGQKAPTLAERLADLPAASVKAKKDDGDLVVALYEGVLKRKPMDNEEKQILGFLGKSKDRLAAARDVVWAMINTREFATIHGLTLETAMKISDEVSAKWAAKAK